MRSAKFDSIKGITITLVVFAHLVEFLCGTNGVYGVLRAVIYSFHMPLFVFISGYFSKNVSDKLDRLVADCLIPYFLFNTLLALCSGRIDSALQIFSPYIVYWYLLSLFIWRVIITPLSKVKYLLVISVILSLYIGAVSSADRFFSLSRTISMFPFFVFGYFCNTECLTKITSINKKVAISTLLAVFIFNGINGYFNIIPMKMYEFIQSYSTDSVSIPQGMLFRALLLVSAFISTVCIVNLVPETNNFFTKIGKNSLIIYVLHMFFVKGFKLINIARFTDNTVLQIMLCAALACGIIAILSIKPIKTAYNKTMKLLCDCLIGQSTYDTRSRSV